MACGRGLGWQRTPNSVDGYVTKRATALDVGEMLDVIHNHSHDLDDLLVLWCETDSRYQPPHLRHVGIGDLRSAWRMTWDSGAE